MFYMVKCPLTLLSKADMSFSSFLFVTFAYAKIIDQKKDEAVNRVNDIFKD